MITEKKCKKCGYEWVSRLKKPKECPKCKSRDWEDEDYDKKDK